MDMAQGWLKHNCVEVARDSSFSEITWPCGLIRSRFRPSVVLF
jgi:hypothetical protein